MVGRRPLEFRILCLEDSASDLSHHPQDVLLAQLSPYAEKREQQLHY